MLWACGPEDDGVFYDEPSVKMVLINKDSLDTLNALVKVLQIELDSIAVLRTKSSRAADSLLELINDFEVQIRDVEEILESITEKEDSLRYRDTLALFLDSLETTETLQLETKAVYDAATVRRDTLNKTKAAHNSSIKLIQSGLMQISSITNLLDGSVVSYEDSAEVWRLPLDMNLDSVYLSIRIKEEDYWLIVKYQREVIADEFDYVVIKASQISVAANQHNFQSLDVDCKTDECIDDETILRINF